MAFKNTENIKQSQHFVKTHLIKQDSNEFIVNVYHGKTVIEAELVLGIPEALKVTRNKATQYNCLYEFAGFHNN